MEVSVAITISVTKPAAFLVNVNPASSKAATFSGSSGRANPLGSLATIEPGSLCGVVAVGAGGGVVGVGSPWSQAEKLRSNSESRIKLVGRGMETVLCCIEGNRSGVVGLGFVVTSCSGSRMRDTTSAFYNLHPN